MPNSTRQQAYYSYPDPHPSDNSSYLDHFTSTAAAATAMKQEEDTLPILPDSSEETYVYNLDDGPNGEELEQDDPHAEHSAAAGTSSSGGARRSGRTSYRKSALRQQFTACGACRVRRVKCDLKDIPRPFASDEPPQCSNCKLRHLRCVDEYGKKPAKALRRGKRLIEVERLYGYMNGETSASGSPIGESFPGGGGPFADASPPHVFIPHLEPQFFTSPFFRLFYLQRPILDELEFGSLMGPFPAHYHPQASHPSLLGGDVSDLLGKVLAIWALSYGVDTAGNVVSRSRDDMQARLERCVPMVGDVVRQLDTRGLLRRVGWDTARLLFLLLPLTHEIMDEPTRRHLYRTTFLQVQELCASDPAVRKGAPMDTRHFLKLRVLWYAMMFEGTKIALHGGPLVLDEETWADRLPVGSLPHKLLSSSTSTSQSRRPSPTTLALHSHLATVWRYALPPTNVALACRLVHSCLTSSRARAQREVDEDVVGRVWEVLAGCWDEFERLKARRGVAGVEADNNAGERDSQGSPNVLDGDETEMYCCRWQIFLVECYAVVRGALAARLAALHSSVSPASSSASIRPSSSAGSPPSAYNPSSASSSPETSKLHRLLAAAESRCYEAARGVARALPWLVRTSFFGFDATLVCDGVFFAARILASGPHQDEQAQQAVERCVEALRQMHWCYGGSVQRERELFDGLRDTPWMAYQQQHAQAAAASEAEWHAFHSAQGSHDSFDPHHPHHLPAIPSSPVYALPGAVGTYDLSGPSTVGDLTPFQSLRPSAARPDLHPLQVQMPIMGAVGVPGVSVSGQTSMSPLSPQHVFDLSNQPLSPDSLTAQQTFAFAGPPYLDAASASPTTAYSSRPPSAHQPDAAAYPGAGAGYGSGLPSFTSFTSSSAVPPGPGRPTHVFRPDATLPIPKPSSSYDFVDYAVAEMDILPRPLQAAFNPDLSYPFVFGATF